MPFRVHIFLVPLHVTFTLTIYHNMCSHVAEVELLGDGLVHDGMVIVEYHEVLNLMYFNEDTVLWGRSCFNGAVGG